MIIKKRKDMNNLERVNQIVKRLEKNEKYRSFWFRSDLMFGIYFLLIVCYLTIEQTLFDISFNIGILSIVISFLLIVVIILVKTKKDKIITQCDCIQAKVNIKETTINPPSRRYRAMARYYFVAYYVKNERTYRYQCVVRDEQLDLYYVMLKLLEEGEIPFVNVLVFPHNRKKYKMLGYKLIQDILRQNLDIVSKELDEYYNTSIKWKYIK